MKLCTTIITAAVLLAAGPAVQAVTPGQVDNFQTPGVADWATGFSATATHIPDGGPGGDGDGYLELKRDSFAFHLTTKNTSQWTGDYSTANVSALGIDLNPIFVPVGAENPGGILGIRLVILGPGGAFTSTNPTILTPGWNNYVFEFADMMFLPGSGNDWPGGGTLVLDDTLAAVSRVLIRNDPDAIPTDIGDHPPHILATLGIDDVRALPEGDVNADGFVGADDLVGVLTFWGQNTTTRQQGELTGDSFVGSDDYVEVLTNWGSGTLAEPVPEPTTLSVLLLTGVFLLRHPSSSRK